MFDLRIIREQPDRVRDSLNRRGGDAAMVDAILDADTTRRTALAELEALRAQRNTASKEIGRMKDDAEREARKAQVREINVHIETLEKTVGEADTRLNDLVAQVPNIPDDDVPFGKDDSENVILRAVGAPREFDFAPKAHWDLGPALGILDFERGVKLAGSRFYVLTGAGAKLQRALIQWLLDLHVAQGYYEVYPPFMVKESVVYGSGQLPKFRDNLFHDVEKDAWFVPTAEVPITGLHQDEILDAAKLPLHYVAYTPCFRKEPMSAGKDVRGIKRGFQFDKVEMYKFCLPENSAAELETLRQNAEDTCAALGIPYRVKILCTGDIGFAARKTYDIEMWAPGQDEWLEVSSCSNVGDFQARRANIRFRREAGAKTEFAHTLNGSGLGIPRTMIAIMENYQQKDGSIVVPEVLRPYTKMVVIK
ncbi:MAG: serine--tRNA ligase [Chloroflexi bacterium]|nr:serine--tRNA ligase [Chloroflexota bacterium]